MGIHISRVARELGHDRFVLQSLCINCNCQAYNGCRSDARQNALDHKR